VNNRLLLDTDVLIDFLRGQPEAIQLLEETDREFWVSAVSVAELYVGVRDGREREVLDQLVGLLRTIEINTEIARQAGLWRREYGKSHGTGIMDAMIAACAAALRVPLVTLNVKHFPMLSEVWAPYRK
jgi:predicted nucleic acid-binding protein